jgi:hypothetical protein
MTPQSADLGLMSRRYHQSGTYTAGLFDRVPFQPLPLS